jgi:outer membrane cobalamin receptor
VLKSKVRSQRSRVKGRKPNGPRGIGGANLESALRCRRPGPNLRTAGLCLPLFFILTSATRAATIEGTVFDPSGRAVARARVSLLARLTPLDEREPDAQGRYRFDGLRAGEYTLVANAPGFSTSTMKVELRDDETRTVDLHLELSALEQQVVVSASLGGALAPQLGSSVTVITARELEERGAQSVYEVLRGVPGVEVNQTGRRGGVTSAFVRGGNSNYNLVMVDGVELNEFGGGSSFDFSPLPADGVDRVEVTRGPESALYGSNAVTGVLNIVSRRGEGPPRFEGLAEGGSFTTRRFTTGGSGLTRGLSWAYDLSRLDSGGVVANDRYRTQSALLSLGYRRSARRQLDFHFFGNADDAGDPGPFGSDPDHLYDTPIFPGGPTPRQVGLLSRRKQNLFGYSGSYAEQFASRFRQVVTASLATNDYYFASLFGDSYSNNLRGILNTQSEITVSSRDFLVGGFEYNREQVKNTFIANSSNTPFLLPRTSLAYFAENRWIPTARWCVIAGLRIDEIRTHRLPPDAFGLRPLLPASSVTKVNPRLSTAFLARQGTTGAVLGATRLHGSFGTGIRAPNGFELAFTNNPRLKPEKSISFDAGVEQRFLENRAALDFTYFYNRFKDQIVTLGGSLTSLSNFVSDNLANSRGQGLEASLRLRPTRWLSVTGAYTRLDSAILALDGSTMTQSPFRIGQPLIRRPKNSGGYNVTWQRGRWMINNNATIRGAVLDVEPNLGAAGGLFGNKGYVLENAGFAYRLARGLEIYGRLNNFLNRKYEESLGFPALHLNFLAGIKFNFPAE